MRAIIILGILFVFPGTLLSQIDNSQNRFNNFNGPYDSLRQFHDGLAAVSKFEKWGFIDKNGNEIIPCMYKRVSDFIEGFAVVKSDKWLKIDTLGYKIKEVTEKYAERFLPVEYSTISPLTNLDISANLFTNSTPTLAGGQCPPNIDFESGNFSNWFCYTGRVTTNSQGTNIITYYNNNPPQNTPVAGRHKIISASNPALLDPYGQFPLNPPDGSGKAVKLGNDFVLDSAEKIRYIIQVPAIANDYSITFQYAVVLENPTNIPHTPEQKPRMLAQVIDAANGNILQCADFLYVAAGSISGFYNSPIDPNVKCKSWTPVFVNLSSYAGMTLYLDFVTADCTLGGHFGYAYVDVGPCNQAINVQYQCNPPNQTTLSGPPGFEFYNWYNNNFTASLGNSQNLTINPGPPLNTIFKLEVIPYNGIACKDTLTAQVTASFPIADAGPDKTICNLSNSNIGSAAIPGYTYQWSPVQYLSNAQVSNPTSSTPVSITYTVTVTDTSGCSRQDSMSIIVTPKPIAGFTINNLNQCINTNSFIFTNTSTINNGSYTSAWDFGDGNFSAIANPLHTYLVAGTYNVKLLVTSNTGCKDSIAMAVTIYPKPAINFSINNNNQCFAGNAFIFTNNSTILNGSMSFLWDFGDGTTSTLPSVTHSYVVPGNYTVKLKAVSNNGCKDSAITNILVYPSPTASFNFILPNQCLNGNNFNFNNTSSIAAGSLSYLWLFGDGNSSTQINPSHNYNLEGNYTVKLLVTAPNGCVDSISHNLTVYPKPAVLFSLNNITQCIKGNLYIINNSSSISSGTLSYNWTFGDGITSTLINPVHTYSLPGNFIIKLVTLSDKGCKDSLSQTVVVNPNPIITINANQGITLCRNNSAQLSVNGGVSYQWTPSNGLSCNTCNNPVATPLINTSYIVQGINSFGCPGFDTVAVTVMQPLNIRSAGDTICIGDTTGLLVTGAPNYIWSPSSGLSSTTISNPLAYPTTTSIYRIVGYDGANCFTDTTYIKVVVGQKLAISLGSDLNLATGTLYNFTPVITNGPVRNWLWSPTTNLSCSNCPSPVASIKRDINYTVSITDIYGCSATDRITIKAFCENSQVFIPNAFTPDGDGINDILMIRTKGIVKINHFRIFNRWGELIFEKNDFPPNNAQYGWDGKIRGVTGPPDVFVYTAQVVCENGTSFIYKGNTSIIR